LPPKGIDRLAADTRVKTHAAGGKHCGCGPAATSGAPSTSTGSASTPAHPLPGRPPTPA